MKKKSTIPVGTPVQVSCYLGSIIDVQYHISHAIMARDARPDLPIGSVISIPLLNPIYVITLDTSRRHNTIGVPTIWVARGLQRGKKVVRVFSDEFTVISSQ